MIIIILLYKNVIKLYLIKIMIIPNLYICVCACVCVFNFQFSVNFQLFLAVMSSFPSSFQNLDPDSLSTESVLFRGLLLLFFFVEMTKQN